MKYIFNPELEQKLLAIQTKLELPDETLKAMKVTCFVIHEFEDELFIEDPEFFQMLILHGIMERDFVSAGKLKLKYELYVPMNSVEPDSVSELNRRNIAAFVEEHYDEYRNIFSVNEEGKTGYRKGAMGDQLSGIKKMISWFKQTKFQHTWEDVLNTTRKYISDFKIRNDFKYLQSADYFISKDGRSRLSALISEYGDFENGLPGNKLGVENELI